MNWWGRGFSLRVKGDPLHPEIRTEGVREPLHYFLDETGDQLNLKPNTLYGEPTSQSGQVFVTNQNGDSADYLDDPAGFEVDPKTQQPVGWELHPNTKELTGTEALQATIDLLDGLRTNLQHETGIDNTSCAVVARHLLRLYTHRGELALTDEEIRP